MDQLKCQQQTELEYRKSWRSIPVYRNISRSGNQQSNDYSKDHGNSIGHRYYKYLLAVISCGLLSPIPALAETVGGVSATAAPVANSSGSVTNQAIQVLQGPYITNTYGGGIQCQGATLNITPYVTGNNSWQEPYVERYWDPVYDVTDNFGAFDDNGKPIGDGILDNPGDVIFHKKTRTGQKDNYSLGVGFSMTWSTPTDKSLQDLCKKAATAQIELNQQLAANKRLDFEIARLKNCGELMQKGIMFKPGTRYAKVCADVMVLNKNAIAPHRHSISSPSDQPEEHESQHSSDAAQLGGPVRTGLSMTYP